MIIYYYYYTFITRIVIYLFLLSYEDYRMALINAFFGLYFSAQRQVFEDWKMYKVLNIWNNYSISVEVIDDNDNSNFSSFIAFFPFDEDLSD